MVYEQTETDASILDRISEKEVMQWMVSRLKQIRESGLPAHSLSLDAWFRDYSISYYDTSCGMHASGECVIGESSTSHAVRNLLTCINNDPSKRAGEKRREAESLLAEAKELDEVAAKIAALAQSPEHSVCTGETPVEIRHAAPTA